ncbi:MAG: phage tail protein [Pseudomonadota bacterium]
MSSRLVTFDLSDDLTKVSAFASEAGRKGKERARYLAANRTLRSLNTAAVRAIAKHRAIKQKVIRGEMRKKFASRTDPNAQLSVSDKPITFRRYGARIRGKTGRLGIAVRITDKREYFKHAFQVPKLNNQFFERDRKTGKLKVLHGPSLGSVWKLPAVQRQLEEKAVSEFKKNFKQRMEYEIRLAARRRRR